MPWYLWLTAVVLYFVIGLVIARTQSLRIWDEGLEEGRRKYSYEDIVKSHARSHLAEQLLLITLGWIVVYPFKLIWNSTAGFVLAPLDQRENEIEEVTKATEFWNDEMVKAPRGSREREMALELWKLNTEKLNRLKGR